MSYLEYTVKSVPSGPRKILFLNWPLIILLCAVASVGLMMLYSVAGGDFSPWAAAQMKRFGLGITAMVIVAMVPIWFWRNVSAVGYGVSLILLILVMRIFFDANVLSGGVLPLCHWLKMLSAKA